jgi:Acyltransferase
MLPPRLIRRLVLAPLALVIAMALAFLFPLLAVLTWIFGLLRRPGAARNRPLRLLFFALVWLFADTAAVFMCLGLWIASGFGGRLRTEPYQVRHYAIMRWFLDRVYGAATRAFGLRVEIEEPELTSAELTSRLTRPVIVLSRHAGPGDSFLLVHHLLNVYGCRPRVVMKASLQLDPGVDVVANRLPNVFINRGKTSKRFFIEQITRLARGLDDPADALVIFPEGGNWTPGRWERAIQRLEQLGRRDLAARARQMPNLLAPRGAGAFTAIAACPAADVIFVAHAGLDRLVSVGDVWRNLPVNQTIRARWWRVPRGQVPRDADHESQLLWLYEWWQRIDTWISANRPGPAAPSAPAPEPLIAEASALDTGAGHATDQGQTAGNSG